jgi:hypothetical protein
LGRSRGGRRAPSGRPTVRGWQALLRVEAAQQLRINAARLAAACVHLGHALPRLGLALEEHQAQLTLVSAGDCAPVVERYLQIPAPEPLSTAAAKSWPSSPTSSP